MYTNLGEHKNLCEIKWRQLKCAIFFDPAQKHQAWMRHFFVWDINRVHNLRCNFGCSECSRSNAILKRWIGHSVRWIIERGRAAGRKYECLDHTCTSPLCTAALMPENSTILHIAPHCLDHWTTPTLFLTVQHWALVLTLTSSNLNLALWHCSALVLTWTLLLELEDKLCWQLCRCFKIKFQDWRFKL